MLAATLGELALARVSFFGFVSLLVLACSDAGGGASTPSGAGGGSGSGSGGTATTTGGAAGSSSGGSGGANASGGAAGSSGAAGSGGSAGAGTAGTSSSSGPVALGYLRDLTTTGPSGLSQLDFSAVDGTILAFVDPGTDGSLTPLAPFSDYVSAGLVSKAHAAGTKALFSIGGANNSVNFKVSIGPSASVRDALATNVVSFIDQNGFDGVDIDYEFPTDQNERANHLALMQAVYTKVKANNAAHWVIFGVSPGYWLSDYDWANLGSACDYAFYFCYDWAMPANGPITNPGSSLMIHGGDSIEASCRGAIGYIVGHGFPASKLIVGMPFYSSGGQPWSSVGSGYQSSSPPAVHPDYLEAQINGAWWTTPEAVAQKIDAVLDPIKTKLTGPSGAITVGGVGFWEWGHENPSSPQLSAVIKQKL